MYRLIITSLLSILLVGCGDANIKDPSERLFYDSVEAFNRGEYDRAFNGYMKLALDGHSISQFNIGLMHEKGKGRAINNAQAIYWYTEAAKQGQMNAQTNLGTMYLIGKGTKKDIPRAMYWLNHGAKRGDRKAQYTLGQLYDNTPGVKPDYQKSEMWYKRACDNQLQEACEVYNVLKMMQK